MSRRTILADARAGVMAMRNAICVRCVCEEDVAFYVLPIALLYIHTNVRLDIQPVDISLGKMRNHTKSDRHAKNVKNRACKVITWKKLQI